jgi:hypothetical protein
VGGDEAGRGKQGGMQIGCGAMQHVALHSPPQAAAAALPPPTTPRHPCRLIALLL